MPGKYCLKHCHKEANPASELSRPDAKHQGISTEHIKTIEETLVHDKMHEANKQIVWPLANGVSEKRALFLGTSVPSVPFKSKRIFDLGYHEMVSWGGADPL